jgi:hypothetical protein
MENSNTPLIEKSLQECKDEIALKDFGVIYDDLYIVSSRIRVMHDAANEYASQFKSEAERLRSEKEELLNALKALRNESYDLREHCQDRNYLDFNDVGIDGVSMFNAALASAESLISKHE